LANMIVQLLLHCICIDVGFDIYFDMWI
jgi:hypothetical protein